MMKWLKKVIRNFGWKNINLGLNLGQTILKLIWLEKFLDMLASPQAQGQVSAYEL